jgi:conjugal transfer pilin signal peptidase TrbI
MTTWRQRAVRFGSAALLLVAGSAWASSRFSVGYDHQRAHSLRWTVFLIDKGHGGSAELRRDDLVVFETRQTPGFPDGIRFVKHVRAASGDRVQVHDGVVTVNAEEVARLEPTMVGKLGGDVSRFALSHTLAHGEYFVMGTESGSYDSRYYGVISAGQVVGRAWGVW